MKPVICGVDIGSWTFKICAYDSKSFQVLTNEANFRETPSLIGFTPNERLIGQQALNKIKSNYMNTIRAPLRLIGLEKSFELIEEELKYSTAKYEIGDELSFYIQLDKKKVRVQSQQLLIALMGKIRRIIESHNLRAEHLYISTPSFLSQHERKIIKKCAEIAQTAGEIQIVDDWICLATEYSFNRLKQIKLASRTVLFADIGYSKLSLFVVEFTFNESRLLDCQHMRFIGSKNMDHLVAEFYDQHFKNTRKSPTSIFSVTKSYVKLNDYIEKQRKILSANADHHLNVECLIEDDDLSYNMKRQEFQKIINPIFLQMKVAFGSIKSRMPQGFKLHSIELLGGVSRIPYIKTLINDIFSIQPSKTLNQSQAMVHGATVYAAKDLNLFTYDYNVANVNLIDIYACWNFSKGLNYFGEDQSQYLHKRIIFSNSCKVPSENEISFGNEGPIQLYIYYGQNTSRKTIGYVRFKTPNKVLFTLDSSKIVHAKLNFSTFDVCKFFDKKQEKWIDMRRLQFENQISQDRIRTIYELKNHYEAKLYVMKEKMNSYKEVMSFQEFKTIEADLKRIEDWIQNENNRVLNSEEDLILYQHKTEEILKYLQPFQILQSRRKSVETLSNKYMQLKCCLQQALLQNLNQFQQRKLTYLLMWAVQSYEKMKDTQWEGYYLTDSSLEFAYEEMKKLMNI